MPSTPAVVPGQNVLGPMLFFDNNQISLDLTATRFLGRLHMAGCIAVVLSDVVDTEVADAPDDIYERLTDDAARFRLAFG